MCGIFGLVAKNNSDLSSREVKKTLANLFILSESRGKESAGIAVKNISKKTINILKQPMPAHKLIKSREYKDFLSASLAETSRKKIDSSFAAIGHSRLVTNGSQEDNNNNQPVIKKGLVAVHNGIITNVAGLWAAHPNLKRAFEVDTEVFLEILRLNFNAINS